MYVPALARAHLAAESVISANKVSLGRKGVAGASGGGRRGCHPSPATYPLLAQHIHVRVHVYTYELAAVASLEQGGDNKICDNQPQRRRRRHDALSDELSGDVRHVTCTSISLLSFSPFSCPLSLRLFPLPHISISIFILISTSTSIRLQLYHPFLSLVLVLSSLSSRLVQLAHGIPPYPLQVSCSHHYNVLRGRKLFSFHDHLLCTIRQQFVSVVKTRHCNNVTVNNDNKIIKF